MGAAGNANYMQMADFLLGFLGLDIARDDGRALGLWPWESEESRGASAVAAWLRGGLFGEESAPAHRGSPAGPMASRRREPR